MPERPFHLAFPIRNVRETRSFYVDLLGCEEGRSAERWVDFDFFGHQITGHVVPAGPAAANPVDGDSVPVPHFGAVLGWAEWEALQERVRAAGVAFVIGPRVRFAGEVGEQGTFFLHDPSGNALEFKSFRDPDRLFAR